jgi:hypothetical protein
MNDNVMRTLGKDNLCTYFVLPLVKLNKFRFTSESNFINCYVSVDRSKVLVNVYDIRLLLHQLHLHPNFEGVYTAGDSTTPIWLIAYNIPTMFADDIKLFQEGKFSKMSIEAKKSIVTYSGLPYNELVDDGEDGPTEVIDVRLLALEKSDYLRRLWESYLNMAIDKDNELLSIPKDNTYIETKDWDKVEM